MERLVITDVYGRTTVLRGEKMAFADEQNKLVIRSWDAESDVWKVVGVWAAGKWTNVCAYADTSKEE